jgi:hypothetical protein
MGYRSEVLKAAYFPGGEAAIHAHIAALKIKGEFTKILEDELQYFQVFNYQEGAVVMFHAEDTKWYDSYEDVQAIEKFFTDIEELDDHETIYLRIGEGREDIEERTSGDTYYLQDLFQLQRSMNFDFDTTAPKPLIPTAAE